MPDVPAGTGQCQAVPDSALPWVVLRAARCAPRTEVTPPQEQSGNTAALTHSEVTALQLTKKSKKKSNVGIFSVLPPGRTDLTALLWAGDTWELQFSFSFSSWPWYPAALPGVRCEAALTPSSCPRNSQHIQSPPSLAPGGPGAWAEPFWATPPNVHLAVKMFDSCDNGQGSVGFFIGFEGAYI